MCVCVCIVCVHVCMHARMCVREVLAYLKFLKLSMCSLLPVSEVFQMQSECCNHFLKLFLHKQCKWRARQVKGGAANTLRFQQRKRIPGL